VAIHLADLVRRREVQIRTVLVRVELAVSLAGLREVREDQQLILLGFERA